MQTPKKVSSLKYECDRVGINKKYWDVLMHNATRANKNIINNLVKIHLPALYAHLSLHLNNPYNYYKTDTHLILVHSSIEYFLRYKL